MESFDRARSQRFQAPRGVAMLSTLERRPGELPPLNLDHLRRMTDDTGIQQHATFSVPNHDEGYTTDDNARALGAGRHHGPLQRPRLARFGRTPL